MIMPGLRDRHSDKLQVCSPATGTRVGDRFRRSITVALSEPDLAWLCILIQFQPFPLLAFQNSPSLRPASTFLFSYFSPLPFPPFRLFPIVSFRFVSSRLVSSRLVSSLLVTCFIISYLQYGFSSFVK